jgi:hypothetical protein
MRRRLSQAELVDRSACHLFGIDDAIIAAAMMAATTYATSKAAAKKKRDAQSQAGVGHGDMGTSFHPSADQFRDIQKAGDNPTDQAFATLMGSSPTGTAADPAIMQTTPAPDAPPPPAPTYADANLQAQSDALGTASADPAVAAAANAASTGGTPAAGMDLASIMPYVNMAAQIGGALSNSYPPQPVALHIGHMGGYQSTVPDAVERLRQALAAQRRR